MQAKNLRRYSAESPRAPAGHLIDLGADSLKLKGDLVSADVAEVVAGARGAGLSAFDATTVGARRVAGRPPASPTHSP